MKFGFVTFSHHSHHMMLCWTLALSGMLELMGANNCRSQRHLVRASQTHYCWHVLRTSWVKNKFCCASDEFSTYSHGCLISPRSSETPTQNFFSQMCPSPFISNSVNGHFKSPLLLGLKDSGTFDFLPPPFNLLPSAL